MIHLSRCLVTCLEMITSYLKQPLPTAGRPTSPTAKPPMQTSRVWHITVLPGTKQNSPSPPHPSSCSSGSTTFLHVGNTGRGLYLLHSSSAKRWLRAGTCRRHSSPSLHGFLSASCVLQSPGKPWEIFDQPCNESINNFTGRWPYQAKGGHHERAEVPAPCGAKLIVLSHFFRLPL